jgi:hypothetical protein
MSTLVCWRHQTKKKKKILTIYFLFCFMFSFVFSGTLHSFISYNGLVNLMVTLRHPKSLWTSSRNECTALSPMGLLVVARSASCYEDEFFWCFPWQSESVCYCLMWQSVCCCLSWQSVCYLQWQSESVTICLFLSSVTTSLLLSSLIIRLLLFFVSICLLSSMLICCELCEDSILLSCVAVRCELLWPKTSNKRSLKLWQKPYN